MDPELGIVRVPRIVGAYGAGRIVNPKMASSQVIGGMVLGLGMALLEQTVLDARNARVVNGSLADYLVPVDADVEELDATFVDEHDPHVNPLGVKGLASWGRSAWPPPSRTRSTTPRGAACASSPSRRRSCWTWRSHDRTRAEARAPTHDDLCSFCQAPLARVEALGEELAGRVIVEDGESR